jgi:hypothetical protein
MQAEAATVNRLFWRQLSITATARAATALITDEVEEKIDGRVIADKHA